MRSLRSKYEYMAILCIYLVQTVLAKKKKMQVC